MPAIKKDRLFFAIYKDETKVLQHKIVYRRNKKLLTDEMRDDGLVPKGVFSQKDIDMVKASEFIATNVTDETLAYLKKHLDEWERTI